MSFDLAVWHTDEPLTSERAAEIYLRLCHDWPYLNGNSAAVTAFYEELTGRWHEIDIIPEHHIGDFDHCPWSCALSRSGMAVVMTCVWSEAAAVAEFVERLARKHGLLLFDPQSNRVVLPEQFRPKPRRLFQSLFRRDR